MRKDYFVFQILDNILFNEPQSTTVYAFKFEKKKVGKLHPFYIVWHDKNNNFFDELGKQNKK